MTGLPFEVWPLFESWMLNVGISRFLPIPFLLFILLRLLILFAHQWLLEQHRPQLINRFTGLRIFDHDLHLVKPFSFRAGDRLMPLILRQLVSAIAVLLSI